MRVQYYVFFVLLSAWGCRTPFVPEARIKDNIRVEQVSPDEKLESIIVPYREKMQVSMNEELVRSAVILEKKNPESTLGNVVADAVMYVSRNRIEQEKDAIFPDVVLLNNGGLRTELPAGVITVSHVYELMPFENEVVLLTLTPEKFREMVDFIAQLGGAPVAGLTMHIHQGRAEHVQIQGKPYLFDRNVVVATSDFLATGGDGMNFFGNPVGYVETRIKVRDAIIIYFRKVKSDGLELNPKIEGRIAR
ncbi:MAG: 5'-nucleotidase C-terminal domain-containing protein [Flavobacteriales bacterium]|nr:5'-nucleotidase C-terminal domain-containing protein [Flavobacteriales bacterium]